MSIVEVLTCCVVFVGDDLALCLVVVHVVVVVVFVLAIGWCWRTGRACPLARDEKRKLSSTGGSCVVADLCAALLCWCVYIASVTYIPTPCVDVLYWCDMVGSCVRTDVLRGRADVLYWYCVMCCADVLMYCTGTVWYAIVMCWAHVLMRSCVARTFSIAVLIRCTKRVLLLCFCWLHWSADLLYW